MQAHLPATMQRLIERLWISPLWRLLLSPVLFWYDRFNLGTVMTTYARLQKQDSLLATASYVTITPTTTIPVQEEKDGGDK